MTARKMLLATFGLALMFCMVSVDLADARPRPGGHLRGRRFDANKTFGLGLELGDPTGLTGKYFVQTDQALQFGVGGVFLFDRTGFNVYGDYLWHPVSLASTEDFELPFFVGVGARFWTFTYADDTRVSAFGVRVPVGLAFDFNNVPLDIFFQIVPTLDFFSHYNHSAYLDFDASIGIRYWFN